MWAGSGDSEDQAPEDWFSNEVPRFYTPKQCQALVATNVCVKTQCVRRARTVPCE